MEAYARLTLSCRSIATCPKVERIAVRSSAFQLPIPALPVLYKVLIANSVVILIGGTVGTYLASQIYKPAGASLDALSIVGIRNVIIFVAIGWILSVLINFVLLKIAFLPLQRLRETMRQVQSGNVHLRAEVTNADPEADQLATTFNTMLEALEEASKARATQILTAQEQERKRIARELHDETSQVLTSLLISLKVLEGTVETSEAKARIEETRSLVHQTLRAIRNLSIDLRPSALDDLGLLPALRWYLKEYQLRWNIQVDCIITGFQDRLPPEIETTIYRIVQEALTNTARHAHATRMRITLKERRDSIRLTIQDDGQGFDQDALMKTPWQERGLGLAGMRERATLLKGSLIIHTRPGGGTTIDVSIPRALPAIAVSGPPMPGIRNDATKDDLW
jgi:two-component system sensor histidine kinase UhpB